MQHSLTAYNIVINFEKENLKNLSNLAIKWSTNNKTHRSSAIKLPGETTHVWRKKSTSRCPVHVHAPFRYHLSNPHFMFQHGFIRFYLFDSDVICHMDTCSWAKSSHFVRPNPCMFSLILNINFSNTMADFSL